MPAGSEGTDQDVSMRTRRVVGIGLVALVAACSSPASVPTSSPSTPSASAVAQPYLGAATGVDTAYAQWKAAAQGRTRASELVAPAATYAAALTAFDQRVVALGATGKVGADIATLVSADDVVIADLDAVGTQAGSLSQWAAQLTADGAKAIAAGGVVRSDLGLPPSGS